MIDLISRQAAIDALVKRTHLNWEELKIINPMLDVFEQLPSAQPEPQWIPVEEKLPEVDEKVLITYSHYHWVKVAWYGTPINGDKICFYEPGSGWEDYEINEVTAWMPLPKPYERSKDD